MGIMVETSRSGRPRPWAAGQTPRRPEGPREAMGQMWDKRKCPLAGKGQRSGHFNLWDASSHRAGDLAGAQAAGAHRNVLGSAVHHSLYALDVGLPGAVGATVGMGDLDAELDALAAKLTFGNNDKPPCCSDLRSHDNYAILADIRQKIKPEISANAYFFPGQSVVE